MSSRIALDAFGTDDRPTPEIGAAIQAAIAGLTIDLVGDRGVLEPALAEALAARDDRDRAEEAVGANLAIVHASEEIGMAESPARAVRNKPDASLCVAAARVKSGQACAAVSAGNSGATVAAGLFRLGRIRGVDRPVIVTGFPRVRGTGARTLLLDSGATVECRPINLVQFAALGAEVARVEHGVDRPRVAVLSNGVETGKGTALTRESARLLDAHPSERFEFVGSVEPGELFGDVCDVAVTDGWTGNVVLKVAEGAMAAWQTLLREALRGREASAALGRSLAPALAAVRDRVDPDAHGGAPLIGVDGTLIICHGASTSRAIFNALLMARDSARRGLTTALAESVAAHTELFEAARRASTKSTGK